jgi:hypothetical protein
MIQHGIAIRPMPGETRSGDAASVVVREGFVTAILIDGLGHGVGAAEVADHAIQLAEAQAELRPEALLRALDEALIRSRGAVASVLRLERATGGGLASFAGIGNVGLSFRGQRPFAPVSMPGILGRRVRKVRSFEHSLSRGDLLVLYTDGLSSRLELGDLAGEPPSMAASLVARFGKSTDDAGCVVLRWDGP